MGLRGKIRVLREGFNVEAISGWSLEIEDAVKSHNNDGPTTTMVKTDISSGMQSPLVPAYEESYQIRRKTVRLKDSMSQIKSRPGTGNAGYAGILTGQFEIMEQ